MQVCSCCKHAIDTQFERLITCCVCKKSFSSTCAMLEIDECEKVKNLYSGLKWSCSKCLQISDDINTIKAEFQALQLEVQELRKETKEKDFLRCVEREIIERERRNRNVIVTGLLENGGLKDATAMYKMFDKLDVVKPSKVRRIGDGDPEHMRPVRVTLKSERDVKVAIRNFNSDWFNKGAHEEYRSLHLKRDSTPRQHGYLMNVRNDLNERIEAGESNLRLRYLNGIPTIIKEDSSRIERAREID